MDLNVSQAIAFQRSELDWYYQFVKKRVRRRLGSNAALQVGTWWHSLMEHFFLQLQLEHPSSAKSVAAIFAASERIRLSLEMEATDPIAADLFRETSRMLLERFSARWELRYPVTEILRVEHPYRIQLPDSPHFLIGIPDTVIRSGHLYWHLQHKTMSDRTPVPGFVAVTQRSLHELCYAFLICEAEEIAPATYGGCYLNIVRKISQLAWNRAPDSAFVQELVPIDLTQIHRALRDISCIADRMERIVSGEAEPIDNRAADMNPFGGSLSDYFEVKIGTASLADDLLFEDFVSRYDTEGVAAEGSA
jgi:hypothetical protein